MSVGYGGVEMTEAKTMLFPVLAAVCVIAFGYKASHLRYRDRDPALLALLFALLVKAVGFVIAIPPVTATIDRHTGVPNLGALGIHLMGGVAFSFALLVALIYWAHPGAIARRQAARWLIVAAGVTVAMVSLWVAARQPAHGRSAHYLVQNAGRTPSTLYLLLYVAALLVSLSEIARVCHRHAATTEQPWLRRGLRTTSVGATIYMVNFVNRLLAVVAVALHINPLDWEAVTVVGAGVGIPLMVGGLTMPSWGPHASRAVAWVRDYRTYRTLYPLWRDLHRAFPEIVLHPRRPLVGDLRYRLYRRIIEIRDGQLAARSHLDAAAAAAVAALAVRRAGTDADTRVAIEAAEIKVALAVSTGTGGDVAGGPIPGVGQVTNPLGDHAMAGGADPVSEAAWLVRVARAYRRSAVTAVGSQPSPRSSAR